jgi:hypothetical protein
MSQGKMPRKILIYSSKGKSGVGQEKKRWKERDEAGINRRPWPCREVEEDVRGKK